MAAYFVVLAFEVISGIRPSIAPLRLEAGRRANKVWSHWLEAAVALLGKLGPEGLVVEVVAVAQLGLTCGVGLPVAQFQNSSHPEASGPIFSRSARFQNQGLRATTNYHFSKLSTTNGMDLPKTLW